MTSTPFPSASAQRGIVLVVAMVMLVIMSIIGISSVRNIALEERMSSASHDRSIALQAAEAALLAGEIDARNRTGFNNFDPEAAATATTPVINNGFAAIPTTLSPDWVLNIDWQANARELTGVDLGNLSGNRPRYLIEYRGTSACKSPNSGETAADCSTPEGKLSPTCNCYLFRITARSNPGVQRADVVLQSLFTTF